MDKELLLKKLKKGSILKSPFEDLTTNNRITFSNQGIAVVYAPNGGGKTTISNIFQGLDGTEIAVEYDGEEYMSMAGQPLFHVINDQISRNIIVGSTEEFVLGENIARERQTKAGLDQEYQLLIESIKERLKNGYKITKQASPFVDAISDSDLKEIISAIGKKGSTASDIDVDRFIAVLLGRATKEVQPHEEKYLQFYMNDMSDKAANSFISKIRKIALEQIVSSEEIRIIERNQDAINILQKYFKLTNCVVCDTPGINPADIVKRKEESNNNAYAILNSESKDLFKNVVLSISGDDPFNICEIITTAIETGETRGIVELIEQFSYYQTVAETLVHNEIIELLSKSPLQQIHSSYKTMLEKKLELNEDDELLIKDIIANSLDRELTLERDNGKNIIIKLDNTKLIGTECKSLLLSTGEQNFISLAFELLKAKNATAPIIVLDDPISSFDSIYKNKIVYCIIKFLEQKQQIIFTHNIDLLRLLDVQRTHSFSLYLLGNDIDETCGFFPVEDKERTILLYLDKLLDYLRSSDADNEILNEQKYIISLIPFMRAIIKITNPEERQEYTNLLTSVMHGYNTEMVDITMIYNSLFGKAVETSYRISAQDIISSDINDLNFINGQNYPLLAKTLKHTLVYLYLRLNVEKVLRDKFPVETRKCELLGDFIHKALQGNEYQSERVKLTAKKTLLNEFNHYEGNLNIFQPAIDITDAYLAKERDEIIQILADIQAK